jgi:hypothetical protein
MSCDFQENSNKPTLLSCSYKTNPDSSSLLLLYSDGTSPFLAHPDLFFPFLCICGSSLPSREVRVLCDDFRRCCTVTTMPSIFLLHFRHAKIRTRAAVVWFDGFRGATLIALQRFEGKIFRVGVGGRQWKEIQKEEVIRSGIVIRGG